MKFDAKSAVMGVLGTMAGAFFLLYLIFAPYMASENECKKLRVEFEQKLDSMRSVINDMRSADTLVLKMSEDNAYNIEVLEEQDSVMTVRINKLQWKVNDIDAELDRFD